MSSTLTTTDMDGVFFRTKYSPHIVMNMLNRLNAVNIGRFNDLVLPKPKTTFPRNINDIGATSTNMLDESAFVHCKKKLSSHEARTNNYRYLVYQVSLRVLE